MDSKKRIKIGIIFNFSPNWMGGVVYITNLIKTLNFLDDKEKPEIMLFYRPYLEKYVVDINYPYLNKIEWKFPSVYRGYIKSILSRKNVFIHEIINHYELNGLFPVQDFPVKTKSKTKLVTWFADLQHKYYPDFFPRKRIINRNARIRFTLMNSKDLVVSSQTVADDFKKFFKIPETLRIHVFHFVSVIDDLSNLNIEQLRKTYNLPEKYFIVSNQFHKHKNHKVLLLTLIRLKEKGAPIHLAMTGRFPSAPDSEYMRELHSLINNHDLHPHISLLGLIPRNEQLMLMKHSQAVIQPSLFEGWSTVIEDAISLQVPVIASSIPVNIEQLGPDGNYFNPHDDEKLAVIMSKYPERDLAKIFYRDYSERVKMAASNFINIFRN